MKTIFLSLVLLLVHSLSFAQQTVLPTDLAWNNAVVNFNCVPNGTTDNTTNLRNAARTYASPFLTNIVVYLPKGTYLISDSIKLLNDFFDKDVTFIGEDSAQTIIKLADNAPGFQDPLNPRPMIQTRSGNQAFGMYFKNLTINTGNNNPGAVGIDYITSNYGVIENVRIVSPDGSGYSGVVMERDWPGPGLLKRVTIDGFKYGIRVATCEYSMTMEHISLKNISINGIVNSCNNLAIRQLNTINCAAAINNSGRMTVIDSRFENGPSTSYAVLGTSLFFGRNITATGYAGILNVSNPAANGLAITEYTNGTDHSLFPNDGKSLGLPIEETPTYVNNDLTQWGKANSFNALPTNPNFGVFDAGPGLQAAFNSGKKIIYFDRMGDNGSGYCIYSDIIIPSTVEMIQGFQHARFIFFNNSKLVVNGNATTPLFIDGMKGVRLQNNSQRTIVFKGASLSEYTNTVANTNGKVFMEDVGETFKPQFPVRMWVRQYNPEIQPESDTAIINRGGSFWILGLKTEGRACIASTYNAGKTEILGGLIYPASSFSATNNVAFKVSNACLSITALTRTSYISNGWFGISVQETQNGDTRNFLTPGTPPQLFYEFGFFSSSKQTCNGGVLPIKMNDPKIVCGNSDIALHWQTSLESNMDRFVLQASNDGRSWTNLGSQIANNTPSKYVVNLSNNYQWYRLAAVDKDGSSTFSAIVGNRCANSSAFTINISPNPVTNKLFISWSQLATINLVNIHSVDGKLLSTKKLAAGIAPLELDVANLPTGVYLLELYENNSNGQKHVRRFVKE
jgi:hypothetical protein